MIAHSRNKLRLSILAAFSFGALVMGGVAIASDEFSDVSNSHQFHDEIGWLADSGVTGGCGGTKYCPGSSVTRGQMAAFLFRMAHAERTGHFSCAGTTFTATDSDTTFDIDGTSESMRFSTSNTGANLYRCNVVVPDGATVTEVTWSVRDSLDGTVFCELIRTNLVSSIGTEVEMASASTSGMLGDQTMTDSTFPVGTAVVDNGSFSYFLQCNPGEPDATTGLFGGIVEYTYEGIPAP